MKPVKHKWEVWTNELDKTDELTHWFMRSYNTRKEARHIIQTMKHKAGISNFKLDIIFCHYKLI